MSAGLCAKVVRAARTVARSDLRLCESELTSFMATLAGHPTPLSRADPGGAYARRIRASAASATVGIANSGNAKVELALISQRT